MDDEDDARENAAWLLWIGVGAAVLFIVTITLAILASVFLPSFGIEVGRLDPTVLAMLLGYVILALGLVPRRSREAIATRLLGLPRNGKDE